MLLQNVHRAPEWSQRLKGLIEGLSTVTPHPDFRLIVTAVPDAVALRPSTFRSCIKWTLPAVYGFGPVWQRALMLLVAGEPLDPQGRPTRQPAPRGVVAVAALALYHAAMARGPPGVATPVGYPDMLMAVAALPGLLPDSCLEAVPTRSERLTERAPLAPLSPRVLQRLAYMVGKVVYGTALTGDASRRAAELAPRLATLGLDDLVAALPQAAPLLLASHGEDPLHAVAELLRTQRGSLSDQATAYLDEVDAASAVAEASQDEHRWRVLSVLLKPSRGALASIKSHHVHMRATFA